MSIQFKRATRSQIPLKIGIMGPSGSGKTTAALRVARGLVGQDAPIALLDTENGSASLYADLTPFDALEMNKPYEVRKFIAAIEAAVEGGYKALIIDSASHEWQELLEKKEALDQRGGNSFANWGTISKEHATFLAAVQQAPIHLVLCIRAKQDYVQDKDASGRTTVRKVGMGAVQRDGFEFELSVVFELAMDHNARTSKDRTGLFDGRVWTLSEATGRELADWLAGGAPLAPNTGERFEAPAPKREEDPPAPADALPPPDHTTTAAQVFAQAAEEKRAEVQPISQAAADFVDGLADGPDSAISSEQYNVLNERLKQHPEINRDALRRYCQLKGYLLPSPKPTLARMKAEVFPNLMGIFSRGDTAVAALVSDLNAA